MNAQGVAVAPETSQIDDPTHSRGSRVAGEVLGVTPLDLLPVGTFTDRVDEVDGHIGPRERPTKVATDSAAHNVDTATPERVLDLGGRAGKAVDFALRVEQRRYEAGADVPRPSGDEHRRPGGGTTARASHRV